MHRPITKPASTRGYKIESCHSETVLLETFFRMKTVQFEGLSFVLGQNAMENWAILATADKTHTWAHLDGHASAHVIIETDQPTPADLEFARQLILGQTKKAPAHAKLITAPVKCVKRGSVPGEVILTGKR